MLSQQRLLLAASAFLASIGTTSAFQVNPTLASPAPTQTQLGYSQVVDIPESAHNVRNRNLYIQTEEAPQAPSPTTTTDRRMPNMMDLSTRKEFRELVKNQKEKMTIVRFHAPFCKACKAMQPAWDRLARDHPEINFVNISYNKQNVETRALISQLQIRKVPFGQVYHPTAGLVESANFGKKYFQNVIQHIEWYASGECGLPSDVDEDTMCYESPYMNIEV